MTRPTDLDDLPPGVLPTPEQFADKFDQLAEALRIAERTLSADQLEQLVNSREFQEWAMACIDVTIELERIDRYERFANGEPILPPDPDRPRVPRDPGGTYVYRAIDPDGAVLYVGITDNIFSRMHAHRRSSEWWYLMDHIDWEVHPTRHKAAVREKRLIRSLRPPYNKMQNPDRKGAS